MFAPRLRAARDRGLDHVLRRLLPSGAVGHDDPVATHRFPLALAATGHLAAAQRALDHLARRHVTPAGDVRRSPEKRSDDPDCDASAARMPAFVALGALAAGRVALSRRLVAHLDTLRAPQLPGVVGRSALAHGPLSGAGADGVTDLASTLRVGVVHLAAGRDADALAAAAWIASLADAQPHPDAFLLRRDAAGALVTLWPADQSSAHAVHALAQGRGQGIVGEALAFLTHASELVDGTAAEPLLGAAARMARFARRALPHVRRPCDLASLARGAAVHARALGGAGDEAAHDVRDLAVSLALRAAEAGQSDGGFGPLYDDEPDAARYDRTAWVSWCLHETLAALDEVEPVSYPAPRETGWRVLLCNVPEGKVQEIADALVTERLAACVNAVGPVRSTYSWKGRLERDTEVTLLIKTTAERVPALTARVVALHPYDLPEVIALPVEPGEGHAPYLDWVRAQVSPDNAAPPTDP
ncbi:MAG: divalent-cation tolerance protein CutA [Polyangiales bacterium]